MNLRSLALLCVVAVAGLGFWMFAAGPREVLGFDPGHVGLLALIASLWVSLWWVSRVPVEQLDATASPAEWEAWVGLMFLGLAIIYLLIKLPLFSVDGPLTDHPDAARGSRNVVMLVVAWAVLSSVLSGKWRNRTQMDERDQQISAKACDWARGTLMTGVAVIAGVLGLSPADRLQWATPVMICTLLILTMMVAHWIEIAVKAVSYWRERR